MEQGLEKVFSAFPVSWEAGQCTTKAYRRISVNLVSCSFSYLHASTEGYEHAVNPSSAFAIADCSSD